MTPFGRSGRPEIIAGDEDLFGGREAVLDTIDTPDDEDHEPGRSSSDHREEEEAQLHDDDEYWAEAADDNMMLSPTKRHFPTYQAGCLISSSFFIAARSFISDPEYSAPPIQQENDVIPSSSG